MMTLSVICTALLAALLLPRRAGALGLASDKGQTAAKQGELLQAADDIALLLYSDEEDFEEQSVRALQRAALAAGADCASVWRNHGLAGKDPQCTQVFSWHTEHSPRTALFQGRTLSYHKDLPGWEEALAAGGCACSLPGKRLEDGAPSGGESACSTLAAPVLFNGFFWGFILIARHQPDADWGGDEEKLLRLTGLLIAATMRRRQIQDALAESEERFRDVAEAAGDIVWEMDDQGYLSYVSDRILSLAGYEPAELLGARWEDFSCGRDGEDLTGRMVQALTAEGVFTRFEHRMRTRDGRELWLLSSGKLLLGPDGMAGLRGASMDVSQSKKDARHIEKALHALEEANRELELAVCNAQELTRKAESASRAKSDFLANMSHEIRTPLNAVIGMAHLLQKTELSPQQKSYVDTIHSGGKALLGIVSDILDFSSIESGQVQLERKPYDLGELLESLLSLLGGRAEAQGLAAACILDPGLPLRLVGDASHLGQILSNLVGNAVKFTEQGGICLRCSLDRRDGDTVFLRFAVSDTGIGIAEDRLAQMFQSFSQADASSTRRYGGTGLGLAIAKGLTELLNGEISLESPPGQGTTATVIIPQFLDLQEPAAPALAPGPPNRGGLRVFLVEPNEVQRRFLMEMLHNAGYAHQGFSNMPEAFAAIDESDDASATPRILLLPLALAEENECRNLRHLTRDMHLQSPPRLVCLLPFDRIQSTQTLCHALGHPVAAVIARPVMSTALDAALQGLVPLPWEKAEGSEERQDFSGGMAVPYLPGRRILVVEDNSISRQIAAELLRETGVEVIEAENGLQALDLLENSGMSFDLVFLDLRMPVMDGMAVIEKIRETPALASLPVIAMTASATVEERERCLAAGMTGHLAKPINVDEIYELTRSSLKQSALPEAALLAGDGSGGPQGSALLEDLQRLNRLLCEDDAAACTLFAALEARLTALDRHAAVAAGKAIAVFDFSSAFDALAPVTKGLAAARHSSSG